MTDLSNKARARTLAGASADYGRGVRGAVRGLWTGEYDILRFVGLMEIAIRRGFTRAWHDGAATCGITPSAMTPEEQNRLQAEINAEIGYAVSYGQDVMAQSRASGGKLRDSMVRVDMWVNSYNRVYELAKIYACGDGLHKWVMNPLKEHCADCLMLNGRVYRMSDWKASGWEPKGRMLACRGYKCGCSLVPTTDPITPGQVPRVF